MEELEPLVFDVSSNPLAQELSSLILDEYRCISVKINYAKDEYQEGVLAPPDEFGCVLAYLRDSNIDVVFSTCGLHLKGENKRPHIHYHLIVKALPTGTFQSNNSLHRNRWLAKEGNDVYSFENTSFRFPKKENPVWQQLAYPFKEGLPIVKGIKNISKYKDFLMTYGTNLYQVSLGNRARQEACDERKKTALLSLAKLCEEHKSEFSDYRQMVIWLDTNYIDTLPLEEKPDPRNYKTNCQKICIHLGKLKYSDII